MITLTRDNRPADGTRVRIGHIESATRANGATGVVTPDRTSPRNFQVRMDAGQFQIRNWGQDTVWVCVGDTFELLDAEPARTPKFNVGDQIRIRDRREITNEYRNQLGRITAVNPRSRDSYPVGSYSGERQQSYRVEITSGPYAGRNRDSIAWAESDLTLIAPAAPQSNDLEVGFLLGIAAANQKRFGWCKPGTEDVLRRAGLPIAFPTISSENAKKLRDELRDARLNGSITAEAHDAVVALLPKAKVKKRVTIEVEVDDDTDEPRVRQAAYDLFGRTPNNSTDGTVTVTDAS